MPTSLNFYKQLSHMKSIDSFTHSSFQRQFPAISSLEPLAIHPTTDYGGLIIEKLQPFDKERKIRESYWEGYTYRKTRPRKERAQENYYAYDDDFVRQVNLPGVRACRRTSWHKMNFPNCNNFHDINFLREENMKYLGHGYYRDVFGIRILKETVVFKTHSLYMRYKHERLEQVRIDALVMERLTSAPNIVDIYGFCGFSVLTEALTVELQEKIVPGSGYIEQSDLHDEKELKPQNSYTGKEKLEMALEMAEAIASLHGFKDGVIVHDDIQLCQFLRNKAGVMKLNDFNRAEIMLFDEEKGEYCRYKNGAAYGNYRSPEEFSDSLLNEKIE
mmetsp:Transcript_60308/g.72499  ORF Transcript_60308/g.72499 Transcript_60308/m.72499 type:complete len:331 (-) Transcript_60308:20-1012(-)